MSVSGNLELCLFTALADRAAAIELLALTRLQFGKEIFCNPSTGNDSASGTTPANAVASLSRALALATENQNDIVYLIGTTNAATPTTNRVAEGGLDWNKDNVHLIGICSGNHTQQRARISTTTTDTTTNTVLTISADNCLFTNFSVFHGVNGWVGDSGVPTAVKVTGQRNKFKNVSISGLGDSSGANSMDVDGGSSLWLAESENLFEDCYIGLETVGLADQGATVMQVSGAVSRNKFINCIFSARATSTEFRCVELAASAVQDMGLYFDNCMFTNSGIFTSGATAEGVFEINATQNGGVLVKDCGTIGYTFWEEATVSGKLYVSNPAVGAGKAGIGTVAVGT